MLRPRWEIEIAARPMKARGHFRTVLGMARNRYLDRLRAVPLSGTARGASSKK
jgi:hypothetical protein